MIYNIKRRVKNLIISKKSNNLSIGSGVNIARSSFGANVDIGSDTNIVDSDIGKYTYIGPRSTVAHAEVGRFCSIAPDVSIGSGSHPSRGTISSHPAFYLNRPSRGWSFVEFDSHNEFKRTTIGHDVWIGTKAVIRDGIKIGSGSFIGAGAVVVKDVDPYGVYVGVPAKLIRKRFSDEIIEALINFEWWNRNEEWLKAQSDLFKDPDLFIEKLVKPVM